MADIALSGVRRFRFGPFEVDVRSGELRKHGTRLRLHDQPFQILLMLLEQRGEIVLREDIRFRLWPNNTIVEFDHGINVAVRKLRGALGESADKPRYVETVGSRGYRFLGEVETVGEPPPEAATSDGGLEVTDLTGKTISGYRILEQLGSGGMGVVYRAEDLKLGRNVALKFLPWPAAEISEAMHRRFEHEARAASALNHPHICTIHGLENLSGQPAIVMELVEGETLAARLARGALPLPLALTLAIQMADALSEAHRQGVVHRDLKPANIMLTGPNVKVLDFGLAKVEGARGEDTSSPGGKLLGTPHYMSPEQAQGKEGDARSDIFSFGLVLYEMLTGRRAFNGDGTTSVIAAILESDPLPVTDVAPAAVDRILRRCLARTPDERWQSARDLAHELRWISDGGSHEPVVPARRSRAPWGWIAAAVFAAASVALAAMQLREKPLEEHVMRFQVPLPKALADWNPQPALSPDGTRIAFASPDGSLFVRWLDTMQVKELPGTEYAHQLFWSPDGRYIGFFANGKLEKIDPAGGPPILVGRVANARGGTWNRDGVILFSPTLDSPLMRVSQAGGTPAPVTRLDAAKGEYSHAYPFFLPDGKHFLFTILAAHPDNAGVYMGSLDSPKFIRLLTETTVALYTAPGFILYARGNALVARPFDARRLRFTGEAFPLAEGLNDVAASSAANFSATGRVLVYHTGGDATDRLTWFDRKGARLGDLGPAGSYMQPELSPDGTAVAVIELDAKSRKQDTWIFDLARSTHSRLTLEGGAFTPVWSPDSRRIVFAHGGAHYMKAANGAGQVQPVEQLPPDAKVTDWTADGNYLIFDRRRGDQAEIWALPLFGGHQPVPVVSRPNARFGQVSPDSRWIAYASEATGRPEIFIENFPPAGGRWQISTHGSSQARWRKDGKELFFLEGNRLMAVDVNTNSGSFSVGMPRQLFEARIRPLTRFSVSDDGQRFLFVTPAERPEQADPLTVVLNWASAAKQ